MTLVFAVCGVGCSAESKLRKEGKTPYVRCIAGPEPDARTLRVGAWSFAIKRRVLQVEGPSRPLRVAALTAAGFGGAPNASTLARLREAQADLFILLGGIGDSVPAATATLQALASLSAPSLIVLGGRDTWAAREKALEALPNGNRIFDGTVLRAVRVGSQTLVPLAGAETGRYAVEASACGFDQADLETAAQELGPAQAGEMRWLLSWQAPLRLAAAAGPRSATGLSLGSALLAQFAERVGARGGLYAWPNDEAPLPVQAGLGLTAVPRLFGPPVEDSSGVRMPPSLLVLEVGQDGVRIVF